MRPDVAVPEPVSSALLAALATADTSIVVVDMRAPDTPIAHCNAAFEALTGYSRAEILGRNCRFLQGPDTDPAAVGALREAIAAGRAARVELLNYTREGRPFWNELHVSPVYDTTGTLTHFLGFQHDVTALRHAAAEVARLHAAEIARARELERLKDEFLATVAHELRTPVHVMNGLIQLMLTGEGGPLTPQQQADLAALRAQTAVLGELVGDLLDFGQLRAGRLSLRPEAIDLAELAPQVAATFAMLAKESEVRLDVAAGAPVLAWAEGRRVAQVIRNLIHNAIQASAPGTRVDVVVTSSGGRARVAVTDRGSGIPLADQERLFERFVRLRPAGEGPAGTGLGLAIAKELVEASGGQLGVDSTFGSGSTFWFELPAP